MHGGKASIIVSFGNSSSLSFVLCLIRDCLSFSMRSDISGGSFMSGC